MTHHPAVKRLFVGTAAVLGLAALVRAADDEGARAIAAAPAASAEVRLGLRELLALAVSHYPEVAVAQHEEAGARALESLAWWTRWSPKAKSTTIVGVVPDARGTIFDSPDTATDLDQLSPFWRFKVELSQPLYTFGRLADAQRAAKSLVASTAAKVEAKEAVAAGLAVRGYFGWLLANGSLSLIDEVRGKVDELLAKLEDPGEDDPDPEPMDILRAKSYSLQLERLRAGVARDREIAATGLRLLAQRPLDQPIRPLPDELEALTPDDDDIATGLAEAANRPELREVELAARAKQYWSAVQRKESLPAVGIEGRYDYGRAPGREKQDNPFVYEPFNTRSIGAVLAMQWNFNFKQNSATAGKSAAEAAELRAKHEALWVKTQYDVAEAHARLQAARTVLEVSKRSLSSSANWFRLAEENYGLDTASLKDVIDAYSNYIQTRSAHLTAVHDLNLAAVGWRLAIGRPAVREGETP